MDALAHDILETIETPPGVDFLRDQAYFRSHEAEFMRGRPGKFVAIRGEEVVGVANKRRELLDLVVQRYNEHVYFFSEKVCPESFSPPGDPVYLML
jgi:hypothetical protein